MCSKGILTCWFYSPLHLLVVLSRIAFADWIFPYLDTQKHTYQDRRKCLRRQTCVFISRPNFCLTEKRTNEKMNNFHWELAGLKTDTFSNNITRFEYSWVTLFSEKWQTVRGLCGLADFMSRSFPHAVAMKSAFISALCWNTPLGTWRKHEQSTTQTVRYMQADLPTCVSFRWNQEEIKL